MTHYLEYNQTECHTLSQNDPRLGAVIKRLGMLRREYDDDMFSSVIHQILAQQISSKALETIWMRVLNTVGTLTPETLLSIDQDRLRACGISLRKVSFIMAFSQKVATHEFDINALESMPDDLAIETLCRLRGIGCWTAQMVLLFGLRRPNILSYEDFGIRRGLCLLHQHESLSLTQFKTYKSLYSPYGSVASLYLWEIASGRHGG